MLAILVVSFQKICRDLCIQTFSCKSKKKIKRVRLKTHVFIRCDASIQKQSSYLLLLELSKRKKIIVDHREHDFGIIGKNFVAYGCNVPNGDVLRFECMILKYTS